jgi:hypothetical protein
MKRANVDIRLLKEGVELIDIQADLSNYEDKIVLDGLANFLDLIVSGRVVCFYKDENGTD